MKINSINKAFKRGRLVASESFDQNIELNLCFNEPSCNTRYWRLAGVGEVGTEGPGSDFIFTGLTYQANKENDELAIDYVSIGAGERKALLLDRDGILIRDTAYPGKKSDVIFMDEVIPVLKLFRDSGYIIAVLTNQSGIGRGKYTENDFVETTRYIHQFYQDHGIKIESTYHCPFHPDATVDGYKKVSGFRKPYPGMALQAAQELKIDLSQSFMIGDRQSDRLKISYLKSFIINEKDEKSDFKSFDEMKTYFESILKPELNIS
ncbi:MAG: hypothetical protein CME71_04245 [Halobacteriovorax sp.]|nr:hypothetical protein [Halobacteriovorax sp.]|tara:strand:- start:498 stop:1289 length:792 start_codon:yes stop_codon:yes gene_type:complete